MKKLSTLVALGLIALSNVAFAADAATCESKATDKKLAGAAKNSFMKKCEREAKASGAGAACETQAADKKLKGAAKNSFVKKCTKDASAPAPAAAASAPKK